MQHNDIVRTAVAMLVAATAPAASAWAATTVQIGTSGKTFASSAVQCAVDPVTGFTAPMVEAGLFNPRQTARGAVSLNGSLVTSVTASDPVAQVWLASGANAVVVSLGRKTADKYQFNVIAGLCTLPEGNWLSSDGTLEYGASGKSYATVTPGCALSPATGQPQPYVNLFDNGGYLLNVSVNGVPLTQLSIRKTHAPIFLGAGTNVISVANGSLSTDYFVRSGGDGRCLLP
jgi:hypothetical protein